MWLRRLTLAHVRTYHHLDLDLEPGASVFLGENAQGKTNLLEAIYLLAVARATRVEHDAEIIAWDAPDRPAVARIAGEVERASGHVKVEVVVTRAEGETDASPDRVGRAGKRLRLNGVPRRAADFVGRFSATLFSVDDLLLISGPPAGRRRYLDLTLSQTDPAYTRALQRYGRVVQQRNHLLRRIGAGEASPVELAFWDDELVRNGAALLKARASALADLAVEARTAHAALTEGREELAIAYEPRLPECDGPSLAAADVDDVARAFASALRAAQPREVGAGMTLVGPHRDDVRFAIDGAPAGAFGSRAQQRTAALALRVAEARYLRAQAGDDPVLLLDDVLSEMDARRRIAVLEAAGEFQQTLITATDADRFPSEFLAQAAVYRVEAGGVSRA